MNRLDFFSLFVLVTSAALATSHAPAREIVDTGLLGRGEVHWIDNERILFAGYEGSGSDTDSTKTPGRTRLYTWNWSTRQAAAHADLPEADYICYSNGFISYAVLKNGARYIREGKLGAEAERQWVPSAPGSKIDRNDITCKDLDFGAAGNVYPGFLFIPLRSGDGYYGWKRTDSSAEESLMYFLPAGAKKKPIALPIKAGEKRRISYSEHRAAYVIERSELSKRDKDKVPGGKVWLLFPSGKVSEVQIPDGPWLRATWGYAPTRKGWVVASRATGRKSNFDAGDAGIYLVSDKKAERLITGFPGIPAVSPDGCRIASVVNPLTGPGLRATLRVINLCKQGE
jgi:hypothetical protein